MVTTNRFIEEWDDDLQPPFSDMTDQDNLEEKAMIVRLSSDY